MSAKTVITCDHCGKEIHNNCDERFSHMGCNAAFAMGTIDACSREHLGLALAKAFGLPIAAKAADLFVEHAKSEARRVFLETDVKRLEARIAELERQDRDAFTPNPISAIVFAEAGHPQPAHLFTAPQPGTGKGLQTMVDSWANPQKEWDAAITLPTKPTKPLRERLEELAAYWYRGGKDDKELNGAYRLARQECAKELREVIDDPR